MLSKNKIKYLKSLQSKKYRLQERKFVVEGDKILKEILLSSYDILTIFATKNWIESHKVLLNDISSPVIEADKKQLHAVSSLTTTTEVITEVQMPVAQHGDLSLNAPLHLYLDGIRDPGNMGTIIRTAAWFGLPQILCSLDSVDFYNNKVLQATMGSFCHVDMLVVDHENLIRQLPAHRLVGATLTGTPISEFQKPQNMVLIIGNEGKGISENLLIKCKDQITISKSRHSKTESLNAAISASILLHALT